VPLKCREATEFISGYLAGELSGETLALFERHISRCANCAAFLEQFKRTMRATELLREDDDATTVMPDDLVRGIMAALGRKDD
jgi:predicted anti-sigma-YlaC factor YlaD